MAKKRLYLGDVFAIPLPDGRVAYGQYVHRDCKWGYLVRVFDYFALSDDQCGSELLANLSQAEILVGPVFVAFGDAIRSERRRIVGRMPVRDFEYPGFLSVLEENYQPRGRWSYWDGEQKHNLGPVLPLRYRDVEILAIWGTSVLAERIATGENPYGDMVRKAAVG